MPDSSSSQLRVGAIGAGGRLESHAAAIVEAGDRLVAAFDIDEARVQEAATAYGATPYTDLEAMLAAEQLDVVTVVTPPWVRGQVVEPALAAGVPAILVEKPVSLVPSESTALVAACAGRFVAVNTQYQWMPHWRALLPRVAAGELGEIHTIRCSTQLNILEQAPHTTDLAMSIARHAGLPMASSVTAWASGVDRYDRGERVPSNIEATFALGDARLTMIHGDVGLTVGGETDVCLPIVVEAVGTKGRLWVSLTRGWQLHTEDGGSESGPTDWLANDLQAQTAVFEQLGAFLRDGTDPAEFPTIIERSAAYQDMLYGAIAAALTGETVDLSQPIDEAVLTDDALWARLGAERAAS